jgi:hypothetical protein
VVFNLLSGNKIGARSGHAPSPRYYTVTVIRVLTLSAWDPGKAFTAIFYLLVIFSSSGIMTSVERLDVGKEVVGGILLLLGA